MLLLGPGPLRFVKDCNMIVWEKGVALAAVPFVILFDMGIIALTCDADALEVLPAPEVDHLYELLDFRSDIGLAYRMILFIKPSRVLV